MGRSNPSSRVNTSKGGPARQKINSNTVERIKELTLELQSITKHVTKLEHYEIDLKSQHAQQLADLQGQMIAEREKMVELEMELKKREQLEYENEKLRKEIADQKAEIEKLKLENSRLIKHPSPRTPNGNSNGRVLQNRMKTRSPNVSRRIQEVLEEIENRHKPNQTSPPSDDEIKATILVILRTADLDVVTMRDVVRMTQAKYSKFDLSGKKGVIRSFVRNELAVPTPYRGY